MLLRNSLSCLFKLHVLCVNYGIIRRNMEVQEARSTSDRIKEMFISAVHFTALFYALLVVYLCLCSEFQLFTFHPLLLSFGVDFCNFLSVLT